jgi:tRNA threonylcarbamoyl adenosine modification protein YeaZ
VLLLALDAATPAVLAAVVEASDAGAAAIRTVAESAAVDPRRHGELLAPAVEQVLAAARVTPRDLDAVVVGLGPGPFTSLRVGVVTAAALAQVHALPAYGVCSLDGIGEGARLVVTDARRREVYWAVYDETGRRRGGPVVERPAALVDRFRGVSPGRLVGASAPAVAEALGLPAEPPAHPSGRGLVRAAAAGGWKRVPLTPLYLRRPDAVAPGAPKPGTPEPAPS